MTSTQSLSTSDRNTITATAIHWPSKYLPGTTDNFVSNETIVANLSSTEIWPHLVDITRWETHYDKCSQITPPKSGPKLQKGDNFSFSTFGFPPLSCEVGESVEPSKGTPGRLAWSATNDAKDDSWIDVYHAWIVEDLEGGRVRILTQESQSGKPAAELAEQKPNRMLNGHQDWLDGLVKTAKEAKKA